MYVESILQILKFSLSIWEHKERTKFQSRVMELERDYLQEKSKDEHDKDDDTLGIIEFELNIVLKQFGDRLSAGEGSKD